MGGVELFIGVVSYETTSFPESHGPSGLAARLNRELNRIDVSAQWRVNTSDYFDSTRVMLSGKTSREGLLKEVALEEHWRQFIGPKDSLRDRITRLARRFFAVTKAGRPEQISEIRRLVNIELSHRTLMDTGLETSADWVLVLEDDAYAKNVVDLAAGIRGIIKSDSMVDFVNLSQSFSLDEIRVRHLLSPGTGLKWRGTSARTVLEASKPATNTVCAILYKRKFLELLMSELKSMPMEPVVPIDWRLNQALMSLWEAGHLASGNCWFIDPAPIDQLSMRA